MEPTIVQCPQGWLATTAMEHPLRIGVVAATADAAKEQLAAAMVEWEKLATPPPSVARS